MRRLVLVVLSVVTAGDAFTHAQSPSQPLFRSGTTLVEVSAVVTRDGRPVLDLRPDEVVVLDNGQPQPLVAFEYVDLRTVEGAAQRRDFVLVVDDLHIHPARTQATIGAALAFVDALGPHDRFAVVFTAASDSTLQFSTDRDAARAVVRTILGKSNLGAAVPGQLASRTRVAFDVIGQVTGALRSDAAERRAMLLISEGHQAFMPDLSSSASLDVQAVFHEFLEVLRQAALANVAIYTVDPRGLRAQSTASMPSRHMVVDQSAQSTAGQVGAPGGYAGVTLTSDLSGSLASLAVNTGGLQAYWSNDLTRMYPRLFDDSRQYYRLAYVQPDPPAGKKQPLSRNIKVKVTRDGVNVRSRQRYAPITGS